MVDIMKRTHKYGNNPDLQYNIDKRREFEQFKKTKEFIVWREQQFKIQNGLCAWCLNQISDKFKNVHVDHAMPLFHGGSNKVDNLVLSHAKCNIKKFVKIESVPLWIQQNKKKMKLVETRSIQRSIYQDRVMEELDNRCLNSELSWLHE
jgi:5-methylcytosine-specific restriction endonuclease McrA